MSTSKFRLDLSKEFEGRRALVTGGSRGIGAATAQRLLDGGATVVVTARNTHAETPKGAAFISGDTRTLAVRRRSPRMRSPSSAASTSSSTAPAPPASICRPRPRFRTRNGLTRSTSISSPRCASPTPSSTS